MDVVVAGASGFVGGRVVPALLAAGHNVRALSRHPEEKNSASPDVDDDTPGTLVRVKGDVSDAASLAEGFEGADALVYLVHSLGDDDFERKDAEAAWQAAQAAKSADIKRIIYLGGLGSRRRLPLDPSAQPPGGRGSAGPHRHPGDGAARRHRDRPRQHQLGDHPPARLAPAGDGRPALGGSTRCQPIGIEDVVAYLVGVVDKPEIRRRVTYDIGGPDILSYKQMLDHVRPP